MGTHYLKQAITELKDSMNPSDKDRLLISERHCIDVRTRHAGQKFKCTLVHIWQHPESQHLLKPLPQKFKKKIDHIFGKNQSLEIFDGSDLTFADLRTLGAPMIQDKMLDPRLTSGHMNGWMKLLENASTRFRCSDSGATPMVVFQNTFFFAKLEQLEFEQV